jgi:phage major head subunit gpT-like protein
MPKSGICNALNGYIRPFVFQEEKAVLVAKNKDTDDNLFFENEYLYGIKARYNAGICFGN